MLAKAGKVAPLAENFRSELENVVRSHYVHVVVLVAVAPSATGRQVGGRQGRQVARLAKNFRSELEIVVSAAVL
jgi:PHP family Zn ribbon phosphoesterase